MRLVGRVLKGGAEAVAAGLLAAMFFTFVAQVIFRYVLNAPLEWSLEVDLTCWLWGVFWGCAFLVRPQEHVTFDVLQQAASSGWQRVMAFIGAAAIVVAFTVSLPATLSYVSFKGIKNSPTLGIPMDWVFSIYLVFAVAIILRYAWRCLRLLRGVPVGEA